MKASRPLLLAPALLLVATQLVHAQQGALSPADRQQRIEVEQELQSLAIVERKLMLPMRDGVRLATDVYRPRDATGPVPIVFVRTPYNFNSRRGRARMAVVVRLGADGAPLATIGSGLLTRPTGIARDAASRRIFVADTYAHAIKVFDDEGRLLQTFGRRGEAPGEFNYPTYVSLAQGELYVTDSVNARVQVFAADTGEFRRAVGTRGLYVGNLVRPKGVAVDSERNLYVVESYYDNLLVYGPQGEFLMPLGGTGSSTGRFFLPAGVWTDARNRVFVADMFNGRVVVFSFLGGG